MSCEVTVPLSGRYSNSILKTTDAVFSEILSYEEMTALQTTPSTTIDRGKLVIFTNSLNHILKYSTPETLSRYNQIQNRYRQGPLLYTDIALFLTSNSFDIDKYYDDVVSYSNKLNQSNVTRYASVTNVVDGEVTRTNDGNDNLSFLQFLAIPATILDFLNSFNFSIGLLASFGLATGFCSTFKSVFDTITSIAKTIDDSVKFITDLFVDPLKVVETLSIKVIYEKLKSLAIELVDIVIEEILKIVNAVIEEILQTILSLIDLAQSIYEYLKAKIDAIQKLFSKETIDKVKEKIEDFFSEAGGQFEYLTVENLAHLIFRFCSFLESITDFFLSPVKEVQEVVKNVETEEKIVKTVSSENTLKAVENGALRVQETTRKEVVNTVKPSLPRTSTIKHDYPSNPEIATDEENALLGRLSSRGIPGVCTFTSDVTASQLDYGSSTPIKDIGWKGVKESVWIHLIRLSKACKENGIPSEFIVTSAYRTKRKNDELLPIPGAKNSVHRSGEAIDIIFANQSVKLGLGNYSNILNLGKLSSIVGWCGIIFYTEFSNGSFHLDMRPQKLVMVNGSDRIDRIISSLDRINISYKDDILAFKKQHENGRVIDGVNLNRSAPIPRPKPNVYKSTDASLAITSSTSIA